MERSDSPGSLRFTAVLINWRDSESTIRCVESILGSESAQRVIVVDNESDHRLRECLADVSAVEVIEIGSNVGFSAGMNIGLQAALACAASNILVVNNDVVCCPGSLDLLSATLTATDASLVAPLIRSSTGDVYSTGCRLQPWTMTIERFSPSPEFFTWACIMMKREVLEQHGLLDERYFMYWEDVDHGLRLSNRGVTSKLVSEAVVVHQVGASHTMAGASTIDEYSAYGLVRFARSRKSVAIRCGTTIRVIARVLAAILRGNPHSAKAIARGAVLGVRFDGRGREIYPRSDAVSTRNQHGDEPR
jgi:GT2 family glycosyltransferase